ncbi:hypothetical protein [Pseudooceanicola atlanticus]|jgi:uncharacterized protein YjiS (DUF1127 family)|uniref:DUF1127 domain-containing protein n=1 Tax=Pseudooceanicola atlanticus TaxID=1461694 RepID=A0A0A0EC93_9RHOB|nr:hypothetical protein [Pseudooceanicola atlanticus]KGM48079.1 hypothetical protein ATO9_13940 [Pseudooceanicola atlanticus]
MANATTTFSDAGFRGKFDGFLANLGRGFNAYMERRARTDQIAALNAKSDAELAKMGITRDGIPAYVFRDLFYV